ncbi:ubiquitin-conjugating enzyme domain-containing protein [Neospora caninum Liverpool]|uniref:Ubiquitin-conjugating enzyme domain-containing protein n=1 Tax=Neospora caninum (strain Liverpool) TaxID=572307 RepID=F0VFW9_NEOCL|nr:ubiquitin-conjugating enzyme domain-containing protein [Neospora caninum Liverpool]CBZ52613.1 ubiquitin-conjugating enzyme domain-containing protein [Neospora caninum Liverpool]CEL66592.1 TPA: ubiquitin-conjugating enzyme domain-containing protein, putative [Neospora caninum Liverpool]|eukprot:XP_003882645.1 ubiquitin-conjugating enzyme domain-containing protein [Neospora caninum Liverpool]
MATADSPVTSMHSRIKIEDMGKSRLLVSESMAAHPSTGQIDVRRLQRTIIPIPFRTLAGVDEDGTAVPADRDIIEKNVELYSLLIEYSQTSQNSPEGVYCIPSFDNLRVWDGVILLRHGVYQGGIFKFKIQVTAGYPADPPSIVFVSRVFHPLVDPETSTLNIKPQFSSWRPDKDYLPMLLLYLKSIFYKREFLKGTDAEDAWLNPEAAKTFREDKKTFLEKIKACVEESKARVFDKEENFVFNFSEFHREKKPIIQALNVLSHDVTCVDPKEVFIDWFLGEWSNSEFGSGGETGVNVVSSD